MRSECADKISKMVGLLGSDNDGDVVVAARGMKRILETSGYTLSDLADVISGRRKVVPLALKKDVQAPISSYDKLGGVHLIDFRRVIDITPRLLDTPGLKRTEVEFLNTMRQGARKQSSSFRMTQKQIEIWNQIVKRAGL